MYIAVPNTMKLVLLHIMSYIFIIPHVTIMSYIYISQQYIDMSYICQISYRYKYGIVMYIFCLSIYPSGHSGMQKHLCHQLSLEKKKKHMSKIHQQGFLNFLQVTQLGSLVVFVINQFCMILKIHFKWNFFSKTFSTWGSGMDDGY